MSKADDVFEDLKLLHFFCKLFGLNAANVKIARRRKYIQHNQIQYTVSFIVQTFIVIVAACTLGDSNNLLRIIPDARGNIFRLLDSVTTLINYCGFATICVFSKIHYRRIYQFWLYLYELQNELKAADIVLDHKGTRQLVKLVTIPAILLPIIFATAFAYFDANRPMYSPAYYFLTSGIYWYMSTINGLLYCHFFAAFKIMADAFKGINLAARERFLENGVFMWDSFDLAQLARCHESASRIARLANDMFSVVCLLLFAKYFCLTTAHSYGALRSILHGRYGVHDIATTYVTAVIFFIKIAFVASAHRCTEEVRAARVHISFITYVYLFLLILLFYYKNLRSKLRRKE